MCMLGVLAGKAERSVVAKHNMIVFGYLEVLPFFIFVFFEEAALQLICGKWNEVMVGFGGVVPQRVAQSGAVEIPCGIHSLSKQIDSSLTIVPVTRC